ncbi:unnamed protein product, partial [Candidula unifasciata]
MKAYFLLLARFNTFNIEVHQQCVFDHVTFYDGPDTTARSIGRYCGTLQNIPEYIQSSGNQLYINFVTDFSYTSDGFSGYYWATYGPAQGCGGVLRQSNGTITSLDADGNGLYEDSLDCEWLIFVGDNKVVNLTITNFTLESGHTECEYDYLSIYDGMTKDDHLLGKLCGSDLPQFPILASSNVMLIIFHTDSSISFAGFQANFTEANAFCGGAYNATSTPQTLTSPNYPNATGMAVSCSWIIDSGDANQQVRLQVTDLHLETSPRCQHEYLSFRDHPVGTNGQQKFYCGNVIPPHPFNSKGLRVKIIYNLATTSTSRGFQLTYQIADCNQNISLPNGRITSPGFPGVYPRYANCLVRVTSPENTTLALYFNSFYIEEHSNCNFDFLEIKNSSSIVVARLCGNDIPSPIFMTDNVATLRFQTDFSVQHSGYDITFMSSTQGPGCGGNITGQEAGAFTSPGFPASSLNSMTCSWYIRPPARVKIYWWFSSISTPETNEDCDSNH